MERIKCIMLLLVFLLISIILKSQEILKVDSLLNKVETLSDERRDSILLGSPNVGVSAGYDTDTLPITTGVNSVSSAYLERQPLLYEKNDVLTETDVFRQFRLRTNMLYWSALVPNIGFEWRMVPHFSVQANGGWTHLIWKDRQRHYRLFYINAEGRYYFGNKYNAYVGAALNIGQFNFKFKDVGRQGDVIGVSITGGYVLELNQNFDIDLGLGLGYVEVDYDKYIRKNERYKRLEGDLKKIYWGPTQITIGLVWKIKQKAR